MAEQHSTSGTWDRVKARCEWVGDCFVWRGAVKENGYGVIHAPLVRSSNLYVHRVAYEAAFGPIPDGLEVDHVRARGCQFRTCCNSLHLEAVTHAENMRRGGNSIKTHCPNGHPLIVENLRRRDLRHGKRTCKICINARRRVGYSKEDTNG